MGLDMRPLGKPKAGFEKRYVELYQMISSNKIPEPSFWDKLKGKKAPTKEELINEWFANQIESYETIKAPRVGRDSEANEWLKDKYEAGDKAQSFEDFLQEHSGYYVIELAKEKDAVPCYQSFGQDENVFRGQFLADCMDLIGEDLVAEAWETKLGPQTLDYGKRLMAKAEKIANEKGLLHLKDQEQPPEADEDSVEFKLHIVFSLAKWLIFYGKNGHGYEADF